MLNIIMGSQESRGVIVFCRNVSHRLASLNNYLLISLGITVRVITMGNIHFGKQYIYITSESHYLFYMNFKLIVATPIPQIRLTLQCNFGIKE